MRPQAGGGVTSSGRFPRASLRAYQSTRADSRKRDPARKSLRRTAEVSAIGLHFDGWGAPARARSRRSSWPIIGQVGRRGGFCREIGVEEWTDEALLAAYVQGNRVALRELVRRYSNELVHFLTRFLGSRAAAEDVFQETFLQIHLSADTFDTERRFKPWLFTIAANKARDYHRNHGRRAPVSLSAAVGDEEGQRYVDLLGSDLPAPTTRSLIPSGAAWSRRWSIPCPRTCGRFSCSATSSA